MYEKLPSLFGHLPKGRMQIKETEAFRAKTAGGAAYHHSLAAGSRPGVVRVNTSDPTKRLTIDMESTAYHEGVPGHHLQIAIQQELGELPAFRQHGNYTAYAEGWALYAERLGEEVGFYQDPWSMYGHYEDEMTRSADRHDRHDQVISLGLAPHHRGLPGQAWPPRGRVLRRVDCPHSRSATSAASSTTTTTAGFCEGPREQLRPPPPPRPGTWSGRGPAPRLRIPQEVACALRKGASC